MTSTIYLHRTTTTNTTTKNQNPKKFFFKIQCSVERDAVMEHLWCHRASRPSIHHPLHGDPDLPAHHDGEDQGMFFAIPSFYQIL
jgi:hypothetical protein